MNSKTNIVIFTFLILILLLFASYSWYILIFNESSILNQILGIYIVYFFLYIALATLFTIIHFPYSKNILYVLGFPLFIGLKINFFIAPIMTILIFLGVFFVPTAIVVLISESLDLLKGVSNGILYLVNVITIILFAYFGKPVMKFVVSTNKTALGKDIIEKWSSVLFTRILTYIFMILIYIIYNYYMFTVGDAMTDDRLAIIKEVLVTFVAIDTLIQIILTWKNDNSVGSKVKDS